MILGVDGALAHRLGGIRVSLFCLTIAILGRPCCLVDQPIGLVLASPMKRPKPLYLGFHLIEGETVMPMLLARRLTLNPVLVIISLVFWFWMWGIPGAMLSVPMLAIAKIICDRVRPLAARGHFLEGVKTSRFRRLGRIGSAPLFLTRYCSLRPTRHITKYRQAVACPRTAQKSAT